MRLRGRSAGASPRSNSARASGWTLPGREVRTFLSTACVTSTGAGDWAADTLATARINVEQRAARTTAEREGRTCITPPAGKPNGSGQNTVRIGLSTGERPTALNLGDSEYCPDYKSSSRTKRKSVSHLVFRGSKESARLS